MSASKLNNPNYNRISTLRMSEEKLRIIRNLSEDDEEYENREACLLRNPNRL